MPSVRSSPSDGIFVDINIVGSGTRRTYNIDIRPLQACAGTTACGGLFFYYETQRHSKPEVWIP